MNGIAVIVRRGDKIVHENVAKLCATSKYDFEKQEIYNSYGTNGGQDLTRLDEYDEARGAMRKQVACMKAFPIRKTHAFSIYIVLK